MLRSLPALCSELLAFGIVLAVTRDLFAGVRLFCLERLWTRFFIPLTSGFQLGMIYLKNVISRLTTEAQSKVRFF
jgi:hypothetical protein